MVSRSVRKEALAEVVARLEKDGDLTIADLSKGWPYGSKILFSAVAIARKRGLIHLVGYRKISTRAHIFVFGLKKPGAFPIPDIPRRPFDPSKTWSRHPTFDEMRSALLAGPENGMTPDELFKVCHRSLGYIYIVVREAYDRGLLAMSEVVSVAGGMRGCRWVLTDEGRKKTPASG